jgi:hypothetical protein
MPELFEQGSAHEVYIGLGSDALVEQGEPCSRAVSTRYGKGTVHTHAR